MANAKFGRYDNVDGAKRFSVVLQEQSILKPCVAAEFESTMYGEFRPEIPMRADPLCPKCGSKLESCLPMNSSMKQGRVCFNCQDAAEDGDESYGVMEDPETLRIKFNNMVGGTIFCETDSGEKHIRARLNLSTRYEGDLANAMAGPLCRWFLEGEGQEADILRVKGWWTVADGQILSYAEKEPEVAMSDGEDA